jgi:hypothetical protein
VGTLSYLLVQETSNTLDPLFKLTKPRPLGLGAFDHLPHFLLPVLNLGALLAYVGQGSGIRRMRRGQLGYLLG